MVGLDLHIHFSSSDCFTRKQEGSVPTVLKAKGLRRAQESTSRCKAKKETENPAATLFAFKNHSNVLLELRLMVSSLSCSLFTTMHGSLSEGKRVLSLGSKFQITSVSQFVTPGMMMSTMIKSDDATMLSLRRRDFSS